MRRMPWTTCWWPGLHQLWTRGSWTALAVALAAAVLLNVALLGTFAWNELFSPELRRGLWLLLGVVWASGVIVSLSSSRGAASAQLPDAAGDFFGEALDHYLKGEWFQAERFLGRLLRQDPGDSEARLMLAALLRRTDRRQEAGEQLDILVRVEGAQNWSLEIARERQLLAQTAP